LIRHLDRCIVIAYLNGNQSVAEKLKLFLPDISISSIVLAGLLYGARASSRSSQNLERLKELASLIDIVDFGCQLKAGQFVGWALPTINR
jgi:predicted nucleic acid-binding protein